MKVLLDEDYTGKKAITFTGNDYYLEFASTGDIEFHQDGFAGFGGGYESCGGGHTSYLTLSKEQTKMLIKFLEENVLNEPQEEEFEDNKRGSDKVF